MITVLSFFNEHAIVVTIFSICKNISIVRLWLRWQTLLGKRYANFNTKRILHNFMICYWIISNNKIDKNHTIFIFVWLIIVSFYLSFIFLSLYDWSMHCSHNMFVFCRLWFSSTAMPILATNAASFPISYDKFFVYGLDCFVLCFWQLKLLHIRNKNINLMI